MGVINFTKIKYSKINTAAPINIASYNFKVFSFFLFFILLPLVYCSIFLERKKEIIIWEINVFLNWFFLRNKHAG